MTGIADLAELPDDAEDSDDIKFIPPSATVRRNIADELAHALVAEALPRVVRRRLERSEPVCLVVTVPGAEWCAPIAIALAAQWPQAHVTARDGSSRSNHKPSLGSDEVAAYLARGRAVIGVSHAPKRFLPSALVSAADAHLTVAGPTRAQLRAILKSCVLPPIPRNIPATAADGLQFSEIVAAVRSGQTGRVALDNLARARTSKSVIAPDDDTPPLESLVGLGAAKTWGLALVGGLAAWRNAEVSWRSLSTSAVICGPPGTGKSMTARALAKSCNVPLIATSVGAWFATSDGNLDGVIKAAQLAFDEARAQIPSILFVDELDAVPDRAKMSTRGRDWWTPVVNFLLTLFDTGVTNREGMVLLGATNYADHLDAALVRPGRFDRLIEITLPTLDEIAAILRQHLGADLPGVDLEMIARLGGPASGAVAAGWVSQARATAQAAQRSITIDDLVTVVAPAERRNSADVWRIAVHEAGHAIAHANVGHSLGTVSIVETASAEGWTEARRANRCLTGDELDGMVVCSLAGRAAEIVLLGAPSAGAEGDLATASSLLAAALVSFGLGSSLLHLAPSSDAVAALARDERLRRVVESRLAALQTCAIDCVSERRAEVDALARALVARRVVSGREAMQIIAGSAAAHSSRGGTRESL